MLKSCSVENCKGKYLAKGYCKKHYSQMYRHGVVENIRTIYDKNKIILHDSYAEIELYDKKGNVKNVTTIDLEVVDLIKDYKWGLSSGYVSNETLGKLHNYIISTNEKVDHIDRNRLNNRKDNLRICSFQENNRNKSIHKNNSSGITGVSWRKDANKWRANIYVDYKNISLGSFFDMEDAIVARLKAEKLYFKEFSPQKHLFEKYNIE